jgi:hypothetical protein
MYAKYRWFVLGKPSVSITADASPVVCQNHAIKGGFATPLLAFSVIVFGSKTMGNDNVAEYYTVENSGCSSSLNFRPATDLFKLACYSQQVLLVQ